MKNKLKRLIAVINDQSEKEAAATFRQLSLYIGGIYLNPTFCLKYQSLLISPLSDEIKISDWEDFKGLHSSFEVLADITKFTQPLLPNVIKNLSDNGIKMLLSDFGIGSKSTSAKVIAENKMKLVKYLAPEHRIKFSYAEQKSKAQQNGYNAIKIPYHRQFISDSMSSPEMSLIVDLGVPDLSIGVTAERLAARLNFAIKNGVDYVLIDYSALAKCLGINLMRTSHWVAEAVGAC